ncbi:MAG: uroporphyrinogen-III synthase, partial [Singulisphaera sp.]
TRIPRETWTAALTRVKVVIRGPKPLAPLRELKVRVDLQAPEPNTWHELLAALDAKLPVAGLRVAVQEYGKSNPELIEGLERRGAIVTRVPVYRWALPEDTGPLRGAIEEIAAGRIGAVLFTSAQQAVHMLDVAAEMGREAELRARWRNGRWSARSARPPRRPSASTPCPSISSRSTQRWGPWSPPSPRAGAGPARPAPFRARPETPPGACPMSLRSTLTGPRSDGVRGQWR